MTDPNINWSDIIFGLLNSNHEEVIQALALDAVDLDGKRRVIDDLRALIAKIDRLKV